MGKAIETIALERGHEIILKIVSSNQGEMTNEQLTKADVAIVFSAPEIAFAQVVSCLNAGVNTISGTTGWNNEVPIAMATAQKKGAGFLHASNFSIGVNIFFEVNQLLAQLMNKQTGYNVQLSETHHIHKKDAPSGTAITLAEQIIAAIDRKSGWELESSNDQKISITSYREDMVPGTHHVIWNSPIDSIELIHTAHNRTGFALGAVLAAEFIKGKQGVYHMKDVLGIN